MASVHNQLSRGPWTAAIKAALGVSRSDGGIERFGETLQPVFDLWSRPEWRLLRGEYIWGFARSVVAVVGEFSFVGIRVPAGLEQVLCTVEGINCSSGDGARLFLRYHGNLTAADVDNTGVPTGSDARDGTFVTAGGAVNWLDGTGVVLGGGFAGPASQRVALANVEVGFPDPVVLDAGHEIRIYNTTANSELRCSMWGTYRGAFRGELG